MYDQIVYQRQFPIEDEAQLFREVYRKDIENAARHFRIQINGNVVQTPAVSVIEKRVLHDNRFSNPNCILNGGRGVSQHCVYYQMLASLCVLVDDHRGNWTVVGVCGLGYEGYVNNSLQGDEVISFVGQNFTVSVKSVNDPRIFFKMMTGNTLQLQPKPVNQLITGLIFLVCGVFLCGLTCSRLFKFLVRSKAARLLLGSASATKYREVQNTT